MFVGGVLCSIWASLLLILIRAGMHCSKYYITDFSSLVTFLNPIRLFLYIFFSPAVDISTVIACNLGFADNYLHLILNLSLGFIWGFFVWGLIIHFVVSKLKR